MPAGAGRTGVLCAQKGKGRPANAAAPNLCPSRPVRVSVVIGTLAMFGNIKAFAFLIRGDTQADDEINHLVQD